MADSALHRLGVVVVTYESARTIGQTLSALPLDRLAAAVVVDNDSIDSTVEEVNRHANVTVLCNSRNAGFGTACNQGRRMLPPAAEFVLFLNPDATVGAEALEGMVTYLQDHPEASLVAPRLKRDGAALTSSGEMATLATELRKVVTPRLARRLPDRRHPPVQRRSGRVGYVEGACMLFRTASFDAIGQFDERYFLFYEELDVARRLSAAGSEVHLVADWVATHRVGASREQLGDRTHAEMLRSALIYLQTWHSTAAVWIFRVVASAHLMEWAIRRRISMQSAAARLRRLWSRLPIDPGAARSRARPTP